MATPHTEADRQKLERRRQILDAAKAVFSESGSAHLTGTANSSRKARSIAKAFGL